MFIMTATAAPIRTANGPTNADADARKESAATLLGVVLGEGVVAALHEGFLKGGDFTGVVPALLGAGAKPHLAAAAREALVTWALSAHWRGGTMDRAADAAEVLRLVLGAEVLAALREGFLNGGDFTGVVPLLVEAGAKPYLAAAAQAMLATACDGGLAGVASLLLEADGVRGEDADGAASSHVDEDGGDGYSLLAAAAGRGDTGVVRALVGSGKADVNAEDRHGSFALQQAARGGHSACLVVLLAAPGIEANKHNGVDCALTAAAFHGRTGCVVALLAADGIDVNQADGNGSSALLLAAEGGHAACIRALVAAPGIDTNEHSGEECALTFAATHGHAECIAALLAADGIDANQPDGDGQSALALAAQRGDAACVCALLAAKGIDHRIVDTGGYVCKTALHYACANKDAAMVSLLLVAGSCRFALCYGDGDEHGYDVPLTETPLSLAGDDTAVRCVFLSGVDYWQRRRHGGHSWAMRQVVLAIMLARQRLDDAPTPILGGGGARVLVHLPEEIWLLMCGFLRSADFGSW